MGGDQLTTKEKEGLTLTIADVTEEEMRNGQLKLAIAWKESGRKSFLLNKTNTKRLVKLHGTDTDDWLGKQITIWFDPEVEFMGDVVGGIRVRMAKKK